MYVLFIPSFPNNRFHLGNIRKTTLSKKERKRKMKKKKQKFSLFVTNNCAYCIVWRFLRKFLLLYFLFLYFIWRQEGCFDPFSVLFFLKLLFLFFFFPFFFVNNVKSHSARLTNMAATWVTLFLFWFFDSLQRNTWRFAPPRFVCLFFASRGFRLEFRLNFSNFRAKVSRLLLALPWKKEKCVLLRTFVPV